MRGTGFLAILGLSCALGFGLRTGAADDRGAGPPFTREPASAARGVGADWPRTLDLRRAYTLTLAVDPSDARIVYLTDGKKDGSFSISIDGGLTWTDRHIDQHGYTPHADH